MMKKLFSVLLALVGLGSVLSIAGMPEFTVTLHKATCKAQEDGIYELNYEPIGNDWGMVHLTIPQETQEANFLAMTIEQIAPRGIVDGRVIIELKADDSRIPFFEKELRQNLDKNAPWRFNYLLPEGKRLSQISIVTNGLKSAVQLKISRIVLEKRKVQTEKANMPLPAVMFKGKPFFPLGAFDMMPYVNNAPRSEIDPAFLEAGGNIGLIGAVNVPEHELFHLFQPALEKALKDIENKPEFANIALLVDVTGIWLDTSKFQTLGYNQQVVGEELERRKKILTDVVRMCAKCPNIIGYYIDEPENQVYPYIAKCRKDIWDKYQDAGLSKIMVEWCEWVYQIIRENHPAAKMMVTLGWWTTYEEASNLYDINLPNEYTAEFEPTRLFQTNYDATLAVAAARKAGQGKTVVYMPGMFNIYNNNTKPATPQSQRYCTFVPLIRGCMGIFGWRLARCDAEYRKNIVYPVMSEVKRYEPYFLGTWHDELVSSDHDMATAEYLRKFQVRSSLVVGKDDGEQLNTTTPVNDVSYCLRRNPATGKYLFLAANNRQEAVKVKFTIRLENLPAEVHDGFDKHAAKITNHVLTDEFEPFATHAYEIELTK